MANEGKVVLITGVTGKQGGALARHLLGKGFKLRGLTRKKDGEAASALAKSGVEIVAGDFDDPASLEKAMAGAWGLFAVQNTWEAGVQREEEQGKRVAEIARKQGIQHFVYASVGSAHLKTGIPHFDNKARVEQTVKSLGFSSYAIIRPVFFMENLPSPWFLQGDKLATAMKPETQLQMIASDDIGAFAALAFVKASEFNRVEVDIAGDSANMVQAAAVLSEALRRKIDFAPIPIEAVRQNSTDFALMLEWFDRTGYSADIAGLEKKYGIRFTRLKDWAMKTLRPA